MRRRFALLLFSVGCGGAQEREPSTPFPPQQRPQLAPAPPKAEVAGWLATALTWPRVTERSLPSSHFAGAHVAQVHVNPEAVDAYRAVVADTRFPTGTWLVERLLEAETGRPGPVLALERTPDRWRFWMLDSAGAIAEGSSLGFCAACHAGAVAAPVFGLPRSIPARE